MDESKHITETELVGPLIKALKELGGKAPKSLVERELYRRMQVIFDQPYYQEHVAGTIPRWRHFIAWAKEIGKHEGLIKRPISSGRGIWELTDKALYQPIPGYC